MLGGKVGGRGGAACSFATQCSAVATEDCVKERRGRGSRELAMEMSFASLGSSHTLRSPQLSTDAASRFCSFKDTMAVSKAAAAAESPD